MKRLDGGKRWENVGKGEKRLIMECTLTVVVKKNI
jgi:hypothetical protein